MPATKAPTLKQRLDTERNSALALIDAALADNRDLSADELAKVNAHFEEGKKLHGLIDAAERTSTLKADLDALERPSTYGPSSSGEGADFKRFRPVSWKAPLRAAFIDHHQALGSKSVTPSGSITVPAGDTVVADVDVPPRTLLSQIPAEPLDGTDQFAYVRQTKHEAAAASVADYQRKPQADYEYTLIEDRARVVASLSPPIPERLLRDVPGFAESIGSSLVADVAGAVEAMVINGDSTTASPRDDFNGILNTDGVLSQDFATDPITTIRKSLTTLQVQGVPGPFLVVLNPTDYEVIELVKDAERYVMGDPGTPGASVPVDSARQAIWGAPVALTVRMPAGQVIVGRFALDTIRLRPREEATLKWSESVVRDDADAIVGSGFEHNVTQARLEVRIGLEIRKPWSFVVAELAAGG